MTTECPGVSDTKGAVLKRDDADVGRFLDLLAVDIDEHPEHIQSIDAYLVQRIQSLVGDIQVDLDEALKSDKRPSAGFAESLASQKT